MIYIPSSHLAQDGPSFVSAKSAFKRARKLEASYSARLRQVARNIGHIVTGFSWGSFSASMQCQAALRKYADLLRPWAKAVGERMVTQVAASDRVAWRKISAQMGRALHKEIDSAPTGQAMRESMARQVRLITSLPIDAAERVHKLTQEGITQGRRADEIAAEIMRSGEVSKSQADLIAVTEISRTAAELTEARACHIGSPGYIWHTSHDAAVRADHRILDGKYIPWGEPPIADRRSGARAHAGCIYRCRCWSAPVIADD